VAALADRDRLDRRGGALLVGATVLSPAAGIGLSTYVFQVLPGYGTVTYYVPVATVVLLVSLGSDYNVFLVGRIWSEAHRGPLRQAILVGGTTATRAINAAGLVLAGSFALLAIVPLRAFAELGFSMAVGLLIDAFVVRTFLVPAVIALLVRHAGEPQPPEQPASARR
jgi:RND superfamily putative drug exporter